MTEPYRIDTTSNSKRREVEDWLWGLDLVSAPLKEKIVTAWVSTWASSSYARLEDMPFSAGVEYPLMRHVNEVTRAGVDLAKRAQADWGVKIDNEVLVPILILHDVDKPLMYVREGTDIGYARLSREIPHGVVGAMLLKDLGFAHTIVSTVSVHSPKLPFKGQNFEAYVQHHADMFCADHAMMSVGKTPSYQVHVG